jgi:hypothetical protein
MDIPRAEQIINAPEEMDKESEKLKVTLGLMKFHVRVI